MALYTEKSSAHRAAEAAPVTTGKIPDKAREAPASSITTGTAAGEGFNRESALPQPVMFNDFKSSHLHGKAQSMAAPYELLAHMLFQSLPYTPQRETALRDLLTARTSALKAHVAMLAGA